LKYFRPCEGSVLLPEAILLEVERDCFVGKNARLAMTKVGWDDRKQKKRSILRPDNTPSRELNPLAAGTQTSTEIGDDAYDPNDMNRSPILPPAS